MDREQEDMQFLGIFGIYKEAYKVIFTWRKIFSKIVLTLILPLAFIFLAHMEVSHIIFSKIWHYEMALDRTRVGTPKYDKISDLISSEWRYFFLFKAVYFTFFLILSLLSTAAVVYTVASIYTDRELSFKKVMSVVPKVWRRLMVTFLCIFVAFFVYNIVSIVVFFVLHLAISPASMGGAITLMSLFGLLYLAGLVYLTIIWHLASVVSVLEEYSDFQAMVKSKQLIKGKMWVAIAIFMKLNLSLLVIQATFQRVVVHGWSLSMVNRVAYGIICFLLLCNLMLFGLVIQTVIYFVCKSYHHENIDKSALSNHLEVYLLGEYVPLKAKDVQLEHFDHV